jgi:hypothetical protein
MTVGSFPPDGEKETGQAELATGTEPTHDTVSFEDTVSSPFMNGS